MLAQVAPYYPHFSLINSTLGLKAGLSRFNRHRRVFRTDSLKFIWSSDGEHELFDITRDPGETRNIMAERPDDARDMLKGLTEFLDRQPRYVPPVVTDQKNQSEPIDPATLRRLRSLGYMGG